MVKTPITQKEANIIRFNNSLRRKPFVKSELKKINNAFFNYLRSPKLSGPDIKRLILLSPLPFNYKKKIC